MSKNSELDGWSAGDSYELYMGRWSKLLAMEFLKWSDAPAEADWLDVGCGTGALSASVVTNAFPKTVLGIDPSEGFVSHANRSVSGPNIEFKVASAEAIPCADACIDVCVSALALNFVPDRVAALKEMRRVTKPGGMISLYVWDYPGGGMGFIDAFWKAASVLNSKAQELDEAVRFPFCTADGLNTDFAAAGLADVRIEPIEVQTEFEDFEAFWHPFTLGAGPAPGYLGSLDDTDKKMLKEALAKQFAGMSQIKLPARAWAACVKIPK